ncbi:MAG: CopD family protein [candidate division KSB1 bacterium]|nr:CopD family protein [candidate division KSB1 bacterium]MDZ7303841.1 CopD family protein [candidate division KSB1 bacterium]MDZ7312742.1 CopD family protein [candidate division KSB1 bacterium]
MSSPVIEFLHLLATVTWIGGMIYTILVLMPSLTAMDPPLRGRLMGTASRRFSIIAWSSIVVLLVTGYLKTPSGMLFDTSSTYGITLLLKHFVFLIMLIIGILITFLIVPKIGKLAPKPGEQPSAEFLQAQKQLPVFAVTNMVLGIVILFIISILRPQ